jgi:single-strand DNA-binding protein
MNQVSIIGRVGQQPSYNENKTVLSLSIATNDGYGEKKKTNWHNVKSFGKKAELISLYVAKGDMLAVTGSLDYSEGKDGRKYTNILVNDITLISAKKAQEIEEKRVKPMGNIESNFAEEEILRLNDEFEEDDLPF